MGASEFSCPRCALDLRLAGAVRLTDPALDALLPGHAQPAGRSPRVEPDTRFQSPEDAVTRLLPVVDGDPDATRVMPITESHADAEMTQVLGRQPSAGEDAPRLLNPPQPSGTDSSQPSSRVVPRTRPRADGSLPPEWFRDPQAEYDGALGTAGNAPAPVFNPPAVPQPSPAASAPASPARSRRLGPVLVIMLVATIAVLIGVVWWLLSNLTSKADGPIQPIRPDTVAAAALVSGVPQPVSDPLDAA